MSTTSSQLPNPQSPKSFPGKEKKKEKTHTPLHSPHSNPPPLPNRQPKSLLNRTIIIKYIPPKISRIITINTKPHARIQELADRQLLHLLDALQAHITKWTDSNEEFSVGHAFQQCFILYEANTVVDTLDAEVGEGAWDVGWIAFFACVGGFSDGWACLGGWGERVDFGEEFWGEGEFAAVEADAGYGSVGEVGEGLGCLEGGCCVGGGEVAEETED